MCDDEGQIVLELPDATETPGRLGREHALARLALAASPPAPYFARLRVKERGLERDLLFGTQLRALGPALLLDWRTALHTEVLFGCEEGDEYELGEGADHVVGKVLERSFVDVRGDEVSSIRTDQGLWIRGTGGTWQTIPRASSLPPLPGPTADGSRGDPLVDVALDEAQRAIVELPRGRRVLVLGEAGHGKTTVALHRLAFLRRSAPSRLRTAVIVPTEGLRRVVEAALVRLGAPDADAFTFDQFAGKQARWAFPGIPRRESQQAPAAVNALKRHPALRAVLPAVATAPDRRRRRVRRDDLLHLFGDRALLERVADEAGALVGRDVLAAVLEHTHVQFGETGEQEWRDVVDRERLRTLDGRPLDEGTSQEDAGSIDPEDYAVLFELDRLRSARSGGKPRLPRPYDCLVLDEAQELAPVELAFLGRCLAKDGDLVVAGDAEQQVDPAAYFEGWDATMAELGASSFDKSVLAMSYRCPPAVTHLARAVLAGSAAPAVPPPEDDSVQRLTFDGEGRTVAWLAEALRALRDREPRSSIAVIVRSPPAVRLLARALRRGLGVRAAENGDFPPPGMVAIAAVRDVKGLEFDHVLVPDASATEYPDTPVARRALYVAITRATHTLTLATGAEWTPLVPADPAG